jgi:hypothetical protein
MPIPGTEEEIAMTDDDQQPDHHHGILRGVTERISDFHEIHKHERDEDELAEAEELAGFDLEADIAEPGLTARADSFDIDSDIAFGNEPTNQ